MNYFNNNSGRVHRGFVKMDLPPPSTEELEIFEEKNSEEVDSFPSKSKSKSTNSYNNSLSKNRNNTKKSDTGSTSSQSVGSDKRKMRFLSFDTLISNSSSHHGDEGKQQPHQEQRQSEDGKIRKDKTAHREKKGRGVDQQIHFEFAI